MPGSYDVPWCFRSTRLVSSLKLLSIYLIYSRQLFLDCISLWGYIYQNDAANRASQSEKFMTSWWEASTTTQPQHNQRQPSTHTSTTTFGSTKGRPIGLFEERRISTLREKKQKLFLLLKMMRKKEGTD